MPRFRAPLAALLLSAAACQTTPEPAARGPRLVVSRAKPRTPAEKRAHCARMVDRARQDPGLDVEKVPAPLRMDPPPIRRPLPIRPWPLRPPP